MPEKWRKLHYVRNRGSLRDSFRRSVSVGIPCFPALRFADSTWYTYAVLTEVDIVKVVVVKAPKSLAAMLKKMFGIK